MKAIRRKASKMIKFTVITTLIFTMVFTFTFQSASKTYAEANGPSAAQLTDFSSMTDDQLLEYESRKSFDFFWKEANTDPSSPGYGLIRDRASGTDLDAYKHSSVASVGFGLSAIVIGVDRGWITREEGFDRARGTLNTLLNHAAQQHGFFYHFLDMDTAERSGTSELSIVDTGIAISGAMSAGEYFGGDIKDLADQLYRNVEWDWYRDSKPGDKYNQFYMGYSPEGGFSGHWDFYGEQFMLYFLGTASPTHPVNPDMFYDFQRHSASYGGYPSFVHSWFGSIFTHQFSFAWFDMRNMVDKEGLNWWNNSVIATKTSRQYAIDHSGNGTGKYKTFGPDAWGFTASDGPDGYEGRYGSAPSGFGNDQHRMDGTVAPAGALGSIVFTPEEVISALRHYYSYPNLIGPYGLKDAYNLDKSQDGWYGKDFIGIDKGITLLMIENYRSGLIWNLMNKNKYAQAGMKKVGLLNIGSTVIDDFEGNRNHTGWTDGGDGAYVLTPETGLTHSGTGALRVDFTKGSNPWANFSAAFDGDKNFASSDSVTASIFGDANLLIKFETGTGAIEKNFNVTGKEWHQLEWVFNAEEKAKLEAVKKILIFAAPGEMQSSGTFYLDDIQIQGKGPAAPNLLIEGKPIVGNTLSATYNYFSPEGLEEGNSKYRWLKADKIDGSYESIPGAELKTYTVQSSDLGSYLKFEVTPVSVADPNTGIPLTGKLRQSDPTQAVESAEPIAKNTTITTVPSTAAAVIDDFDGNNVNPGWVDSGDGVYKITPDPTVTPDGSNALRIDYAKDVYDWAYLKGTVDPSKPYFVGDTLSLDVKGTYNFILKFEEVNGQHEHTFKGDTNGEWQTLTWNISELKKELNDVQRILLFIEPAYKHSTGTVYIDNFKVIKTSQADLTRDEAPIVGTPVYGSYEYYDANGDPEQNSTYRWLISDTRDGAFLPIEGANSRTYTPTVADAGKFLKFEVTPMSNNAPNMGTTIVSPASNRVIQEADLDRPSAANVTVKKQLPVQMHMQGIAERTVPATWSDSGDGVFTVTPDAQGTGETVWKIDYNKGGKEWAYIQNEITDASMLADTKRVTVSVYGNANLMFKFEGISGSIEKSVNLTGGDTWQTVDWDVSAGKAAIAGAKKMLVFVAPGNGSGTGSFKLGAVKAYGSGWRDGGDGVYKLTPADSNAIMVQYDKNHADWANFRIDTDPSNPVSAAGQVNAIVTGNVTLLVKLDKAAGADVEKTFDFTGGEATQPLHWDVSAHDLSDLQRILIFAAPGKGEATGTFTIKDFTISGEKTAELAAADVPVGTVLYGSYDFKNRNGSPESGSLYRWLISSSANGPYTAISGATDRSYQVTAAEYGQYLKFEVTPGTLEEPKQGFASVSASVKVENAPSNQNPGGSTGGSMPSNQTSGGNTSPVNTDVDKGKLGTEKTVQTADGRTAVVIEVSKEGLTAALAKLNSSDAAPSIVIKVPGNEGVSKVVLPAAALAQAADSSKSAKIIIKTATAEYQLPLSAIHMDPWLKASGGDINGAKITVTIETVSGKTADEINAKAVAAGGKLLSGPLEFKVELTSGDKTTEVKDFGGQYLTRSVTVAGMVDPRHATGVFFDTETSDPVFVPTVFVTENGVTKAVMKRMGNSTYAVMEWNKAFGDVATHWAKPEIELLADKLIVKGTDTQTFDPNSPITRAEFMAMLVRALGISMDNGQTAAFADVPADFWANESVAAAVKFGIVSGYSDQKFQPNRQITREEMAVMISNAAKFVQGSLNEGVTEDTLSAFKDRSEVSGWAAMAMAYAVHEGILQGAGPDRLAPAKDTTRAEAAVMLKRLLIQLNFMN